MLSPVVHLEKNNESQSRTIESQLKRRVLSRKCLGLYVTRQLIWRHSPKLFNTVYTFWLKHRKRLKLLRIVKQKPQISHEDILQKTFSDWSIDFGVLRDACQEISLGIFMCQERRTQGWQNHWRWCRFGINEKCKTAKLKLPYQQAVKLTVGRWGTSTKRRRSSSSRCKGKRGWSCVSRLCSKV